MAAGDDAYQLRYRGNILGDELVIWNLLPAAQPARRDQLYGTNLSAISRPTAGRSYSLVCRGYFKKATPEAAALAIEARCRAGAGCPAAS